MKTILGIDVGTAIVGWGVVVQNPQSPSKLTHIAYGTITTPAGMAMPSRLEIIYRELKEIIAQYKPEESAVESLFFFKNQTTVMTVSQARGVILLCLEQAGVHIYEYTPLQVKMGVTGYGKAEKQQVQKMVKMILGLVEIPKPDDAADALAIAITHSSTVQRLKSGK